MLKGSSPRCGKNRGRVIFQRHCPTPPLSQRKREIFGLLQTMPGWLKRLHTHGDRIVIDDLVMLSVSVMITASTVDVPVSQLLGLGLADFENFDVEY